MKMNLPENLLISEITYLLVCITSPTQVFSPRTSLEKWAKFSLKTKREVP